MEFDHLFICVPDKGQEAKLLVDAGFTEGSANRHPGQGTANRRFFFDNAFIELLFVEDSDELQSPLTKPVRLDERLSRADSSTSPFGVCFRPGDDAEDASSEAAPFPCWHYQPEYLPEHLHINIAMAPLTEPMWFYLSFGGRPDGAVPARQENRVHENGVSEITGVSVTASHLTGLSDAAKAIVQHASGPVIAVENASAGKGPEHLVEVEFDHHRQQQFCDFRPRLPLVCRW